MSWIDITSIKHDGMQEDWTDSFREAVEQLERNGGGHYMSHLVHM